MGHDSVSAKKKLGLINYNSPKSRKIIDA